METLKEEGAQLQNSSEQENSLQRAQQAVSALQDFNRHYFELHPLDKAASRDVDVKTKLKETLDLLESLRESLPKVQYWCSKGQALNVLPDYCQEAEECLSNAIKHDPTLIVAWNGLGETYWKAGKVQQAYDCFVGSLAHLKNKESLRNLSMVLRQLGKDTTEREANIKESVEKAKEAIGLDVKDGISWR